MPKRILHTLDIEFLLIKSTHLMSSYVFFHRKWTFLILVRHEFHQIFYFTVKTAEFDLLCLQTTRNSHGNPFEKINKSIFVVFLEFRFTAVVSEVKMELLHGYHKFDIFR